MARDMAWQARAGARPVYKRSMVPIPPVIGKLP
jgi:hypothetical protein